MMATMQAVMPTKKAGPEVLVTVELPLPTLRSSRRSLAAAELKRWRQQALAGV